MYDKCLKLVEENAKLKDEIETTILYLNNLKERYDMLKERYENIKEKYNIFEEN